MMAVFAIGPDRRDTGGYGGSSPREITARALPNLAGLQEVDADVPVPGEGADHGPQRPGGPSATADDLTEVIGVHPNLKDVAPAEHPARHADVVRVGHY